MPSPTLVSTSAAIRGQETSWQGVGEEPPDEYAVDFKQDKELERFDTPAMTCNLQSQSYCYASVCVHRTAAIMTSFDEGGKAPLSILTWRSVGEICTPRPRGPPAFKATPQARNLILRISSCRLLAHRSHTVISGGRGIAGTQNALPCFEERQPCTACDESRAPVQLRYRLSRNLLLVQETWFLALQSETSTSVPRAIKNRVDRDAL